MLTAECQFAGAPALERLLASARFSYNNNVALSYVACLWRLNHAYTMTWDSAGLGMVMDLAAWA